MPRILLTSYTFRLNTGSGYYSPISNLFRYVRQYFQSHTNSKQQLSLNNRNFVFEVTNLNINQRDGIVEGILKTGDYGYEAELYNVLNGTTKIRTKDDAELLPFYFLFYFPKNKGADEGIAILQRIHPYGIKSILNYDLNQYFSNNPPAPYLNGSKLVFEMNPLAPYNVIKELEKYLTQGDIYKIELIDFKLPNDIVELRKNGNIESTLKTNLVIEPPKKGERFSDIKDALLSILQRTSQDPKKVKRAIKDIRRLVEIRIKDSKRYKTAQYRNLKLRLKLPNNRNKTVVISDDWIKIRPAYDITNNITIDSTTGHPTFNSLQREAHDLLRGFKSLLGHY